MRASAVLNRIPIKIVASHDPALSEVIEDLRDAGADGLFIILFFGDVKTYSDKTNVFFESDGAPSYAVRFVILRGAKVPSAGCFVLHRGFAGSGNRAFLNQLQWNVVAHRFGFQSAAEVQIKCLGNLNRVSFFDYFRRERDDDNVRLGRRGSNCFDVAVEKLYEFRDVLCFVFYIDNIFYITRLNVEMSKFYLRDEA